jgi:hypothetical protein
MRSRRTPSGRLGLAAIALLVMTSRAGAQFAAGRSEAQYEGIMGRGMPPAPKFAPQGDWLEVLTATPRWLVLQNQKGQQFPVDLDAVDLFLMRSPTTPERLGPDAWVAVFSLNRQSDRVVTDHLDVFQGAAKSLLPAPRRGPVNERGDYIFPLLMDTYETGFGDDFRRWPVDGLPEYLDLVGKIVQGRPLVVESPDNTRITVVGPQGPPALSLVTFGSSATVLPGDQAWCLITSATPRTLILEQLWIHKAVPLDRIAP